MRNLTVKTMTLANASDFCVVKHENSLRPIGNGINAWYADTSEESRRM